MLASAKLKPGIVAAAVLLATSIPTVVIAVPPMRPPMLIGKPSDSESVAASDNKPDVFDAMSRMYRGDELVKQHRYKEALADYVMCFDRGINSPGFVGVRVSFLLKRVDDLIPVYPPAREVWPSRYKAARDEVLAGKAIFQRCMDFISLAKHLKIENEPLGTWDALMAKGEFSRISRQNLVNQILDTLVAEKRYEQILSSLKITPLKYAQAQSMGLETRAKIDKQLAAHNMPSIVPTGDPLHKRVIATLTDYYECLLATKRIDDALKLSDKIIRIDPSPSTYDSLISRARRVGNNDEVDRLTLTAGSAINRGP